MYQCSRCTCGCAYVFPNPPVLCVKCQEIPVHLCTECRKTSCSTPTFCYLCTQRKHICLSKCSNGCVLVATPICNCGITPARLQVKDTRNHSYGKLYNFFKFENSLHRESREVEIEIEIEAEIERENNLKKTGRTCKSCYAHILKWVIWITHHFCN